MKKLKFAAALLSACCILALILWQSGAATSHAQKNGKQERDAKASTLTVPDAQLPGKAARARQANAPLAATATVFNEPLETIGATLNNTAATATLVTAPVKIKGSLFPNGDVDYYQFTAIAGSRVYAAAMTSFSAGSSTDSQLTLYASDGTTAIEFDDDNGTFAALSSSIAGATIPTTGTYYLRINDFTAGTTTERGYELWLTTQAGAPTPEVEPNDTPATANPLPASGFVSGARNPAAATEQDWYSFTLNAGDTVYLGLDLDPERDGVTYNGRLGFGLFGDTGNQILTVDDAGTGDVSPIPNIPSEALFMTVKNAGTYYAFVDAASAAVGGATATYNLSVTVLPKTPIGVNCTTYTSTNVPQAIGPGAGLTSSTITVPGNPRIADLDVDIQLNHTLMQDIDAHLRSPAGNDNGLFSDIGAAAIGGQTIMDTVFDDDAGIPPLFTTLRGIQYKPENNSTNGTSSTSGAYRLSWFNGENAGGTWTLDLRDDTANTSGGTLTGWSLRICELPAATGRTIYAQNFEAGAAGFTHSGAADEWALGTPATAATTTTNPVAPFTTCNSGTNCWKTDLTGTYNASSNQDLVSPPIDLSTYNEALQLEWAMRHQIETANFDHARVIVREAGTGANPRTVWEWLDPTPIDNGVGNPVVNIPGSVGWGTYRADISDFAGKTIEVVFHLDSDSTVQFGGLAVDDVVVRTLLAPTAASVSVSGRVMSGRRGAANAAVKLVGANGATRRTTTDALGNYRFDDVAAGETYIFTASVKRIELAPQVVYVTEDVQGLDFVSR